MKKQYNTPQAIAENFVPNRVIASCTQTDKELNFFCLQGPETDSRNVMTAGVDSCKNIARLAEGVDYAIKLGSKNGSTGTKYGTITSDLGNSYTGRYVSLDNTKYDSFLYFCTGDSSFNKWSQLEGDNVLVHAEGHQSNHCQILAVNSATVSNS